MDNPRRQLSLLIVEDDEDDFILTSEMLNEAHSFHFNIDWASTPSQAQEKLASNIHDICLMDYRLGAEVGIGLVWRAHHLGFTGLIIMLTGEHNTRLEIEAAEAGAADYLTKNDLTTGRLERSIRYALARLDIQQEKDDRLKAEARNRAKSEFLATLSHEIRTPLTAIIGYTEMMLTEVDPAGKISSKLEIVHRNSEHLLSLLNDTLDLSRIEAGRIDLSISSMELTPFLADILSLITASANSKGLALICELDEKLPLTINSDGTRLRQILLNLLTNAVKFTDQGTVTLGVKYDGSREDSLHFIVTDTGPGIEPDKLKTIFEPFVQSSDLKAHLGTGLGLTISHRLARMMGGELFAENTPVTGSRFTLTINPGDLKGCEYGQPDMTAKRVLSPKIYLNSKWRKVLVVDDVEDIRSLVSSILGEAGLACDTAVNGKDAVRLLKKSGQESYDLLIMDINMPEMNGMKAIMEIRQADIPLCNIPAIALTAVNMPAVKEECLSAGYNGFLTKPLSAPALINTINSLDSNDIASAKPALEGSQKKSNVLIVEDHEDTRKALLDMLEFLGYACTGAESIAQAKAVLQEQRITTVFSDMHLADGDGLSFANSVKESWPDTAFFLVTGDQRMLRENSDSVNSVLLKPFTLEQLQACLASHVIDASGGICTDSET